MSISAQDVHAVLCAQARNCSPFITRPFFSSIPFLVRAWCPFVLYWLLACRFQQLRNVPGMMMLRCFVDFVNLLNSMRLKSQLRRGFL
jgi:hypothetical protein